MFSCLVSLCHLFSGSQHHLLWDGADLTVHLQHLLLLLHHSDMKHSEVCSTEIQRQEVSALCGEKTTDRSTKRVKRVGKNLHHVCFYNFLFNTFMSPDVSSLTLLI